MLEEDGTNILYSSILNLYCFAPPNAALGCILAFNRHFKGDIGGLYSQ